MTEAEIRPYPSFWIRPEQKLPKLGQWMLVAYLFSDGWYYVARPASKKDIEFNDWSAVGRYTEVFWTPIIKPPKGE